MKLLKNSLYSIDELKSTFGFVRKKDVIGLMESYMGECKSSADEEHEDHPIQTQVEAILFISSAICGGEYDTQ